MVRLTIRYRGQISPETVDRLLGGLVVAFATVGIAGFVIFLLAALLTGIVRLIGWVGGF